MLLERERERASRWATVCSVAAKIGCTAQTLNDWVKKYEVDSGARAGVPPDVAEKNRVLRQAREILHKASQDLALTELDRRSKP